MTYEPEPPPASTNPAKRLRTIVILAAFGMIVAVGGITAALVAGSAPDPKPAPAAIQQSTTTAATTATTTEPPTGSSVDLQCSTDAGDVGSVTLNPDGGDHFDFSPFWEAHAHDCEVTAADGTGTVTPAGPIEDAALKASGYDDGDIAPLFAICAGAGDYTVGTDGASAEQAAELSGALALCPGHPDTATWRKAIAAGRQEAKLEADGRIFRDGTFRVGKDIKPGTYAVTDVENCYWERQTSSGRIIDNNFVAAAKRVQVTIRKTDYGFHAEGCGQWRPVG